MPPRADHHRRDTRNSRRQLVQAEQLEPRLALAAAPVDPNAGSIVASQFQPYGYALLGTQLLDVTTKNGASLQLTAPNNIGTPPTPPIDYGYPQTPVNTGLISGSQVNVGGFTTVGLQLQNVTLPNGGLRVDVVDEGIGKPSAGGTQPVPVSGANLLPQQVPPGSPGVVTNTGIIASSQFNDGGFGPIGIQASGLSVGGDLSIVSRTTLGSPSVPVAPIAVPFSPASQAMPVNTGTIRDSQFADGGFGDIGLQLRTVTVGGSVDVGAERLLIQPTTGPKSVGPPILVGRLTATTRLVTFAKAPAGSAPPTSMLYPGMLVTGRGIPTKTVIQSIGGPYRLMLSKRPQATGAIRLTFFAPVTATNTGAVVSSQLADGGFGDIGLQWSHVTVGGRVATQHNGLQIQPGVNNVGSITTGQKAFGLPAQAGLMQANPNGSIPPVTPSGPAGTATGSGSGNAATNSGRITSSQFADGGFGDIGMQWQTVHVSGLITVADVSFSASPPAFTPSQTSSDGVLSSDPAVITQGAAVSPSLPVPTSPGTTRSQTNSATNSGLVSQSQFADGGFGDIGMQWSNVSVEGSVQVVHNSLSIQPEGSNVAGISVRNVVFGSAAASAGDPRLAPVTLPPLTVNPAGAVGPPPFVPNAAFAKKSNTVNQTNKQVLSGPAAATSLQWRTVTRDSTGLVIVNNVLKVSNNGTTGSAPGAKAGPITLSGITFPGSAPSRTLSAKPATTTPAKRVSLYGSATAPAAQAKQVNAASNSGTLSRNQFLDGGTGDIGLQWRDVVVKGSVRVEHNTCSINVVGDASDTGPISISNIRFDSGWGLSGAVSDSLYLTPPVASATSLRDISASAVAFGGGVNAASNSATLTGGQFLDGGMGQIGLQWQGVTINCPVRIVNNVIAVTVSGTNTQGVSLQNVSFA
jgi:hypothetical protein